MRLRPFREFRMFDTHCHLTDPSLHGQLDEVLLRARAAGVAQILTVGTDIPDDRGCLDVCRDRPQIRCAVGVHPNNVAETDAGDLQQLTEIQSDAAVIALGEMGLDYHYGKEHRQKQFDFFEFQLGLAVEVDKPVIIHCREAMEDCLAIITKFPVRRAVFHCFSGTWTEARRILDLGYFLSFTGVITFKNTAELRKVVELTPAERFFVETDAPYLSPEPLRKQKINEPALVMHTAATAAKIRGISLEEMDRISTGNASGFFGWP